MKRFVLAVLLSIGVLSASPVPAAAAPAGLAREVAIAAFIDLFPIRSYNVNNNTYIIAADLIGYGFDSATGGALAFVFNENKDFVPLAVSEINRTKAEVTKANAAHAVRNAPEKVTLNGVAVTTLDMGGELLIPFDALARYGTVSWDGDARQVTLVFSRSPGAGRAVFNTTVERFVQGNGGPYPYTATDRYSNVYANGELNGYCVSIIEDRMHGVMRHEAVYENGVKAGPGRECRMDEQYLYGYHVDWDGRYADGEKVLFEPDTVGGQPFTGVLSGDHFVIFQKGGAYYGLGDNQPYWQWAQPTAIDDPNSRPAKGPLPAEGPLPAATQYLLSDDGRFIQSASQKLVLDHVKAAYQFDDYDGFSGTRTLLLREDGSLWFCRLNDETAVWNDGKDLSKPVWVMDQVVTAAASGSCAYFAIRTDGSLWHFGDNHFGEAGNGTQAVFDYEAHVEDPTRFRPVKVMDNIAKIVCGNGHCVALTRDGILYGWGNNNKGQLAQADAEICEKPEKMLEGVADVGVSWNATFAVKTDGTLWACGVLVNDGAAEPQPVFTEIRETFRYISFGPNY